MPRRTPEQNERENASARARRAAGYVRPPRSEREKEQNRVRARERARRLFGWRPGTPIDAPPLLRVRTERPKAAPVEPLPEACTGHELFEEAKAHLRGWEMSDFDRDMDSRARDLIGDYVLARLEGRDPEEALLLNRRRYNTDSKTLIYGLSTVTGLER